MDRTEKQSFVGDFRQKIQDAPVIYLTDFTGLDVKSMTDLRQSLKSCGAEYLVVKNRLVKRAIKDLDLPDISEALLGPTGVILGYEGIVEPAKAVSDFAKEHDDKPVFKLGVVDKEIVSAEEIRRLAKLPPRDQLLAEIVGAFEAPMAAFASALEAKIQEISGLFEALRDRQEAELTAEAGSEEQEAEASEEAEEEAEPVAEASSEEQEAEASEEAPEAIEEAGEGDQIIGHTEEKQDP